MQSFENNNELVDILTRPRLEKYFRMAKKPSKSYAERVEITLQLYAWNTALSATFYEPLQAFEIALRNAVDKSLTNHFGAKWHQRDSGIEFNETTRAIIKEAHTEAHKARKKKLRKNKNMPQKTKIVTNITAHLSLGFWVKLFGPKYNDSLWRPALYKAFPHKRLGRGEAHQRLLDINTFRNRIAHHEPILHRNLETDMADILDILGWICPQKRAWVERHNRFDEVMKNCPIKRQ